MVLRIGHPQATMVPMMRASCQMSGGGLDFNRVGPLLGYF